jgi:hypothetical protein
MAKRRATVTRAAAPVTIVQAAAPIQRRTRRTAIRRRRRSGRRSGGSAGGGTFLNQERIGSMVGGFLLGVIDKQGTVIPTLPVLGRAGTLGVALFFAGKQFKMPLLTHASTAALAIATYQLGKEGAIAGVDGMDTV